MGVPLSDFGKIIPAVTCWIVAERKVLLLKRNITSERFPGYYIGPGGHIDENEDCLSAARREVEEETGIIINESLLKLRVVGIGRHIDKKETFIFFVFLIKLDNLPLIKVSSEGTLEWINIDELYKYKLLPGFAFYQNHVLSNNPGVMYTNLELENLEIIDKTSIKISES